jgi:hypothetical protein
MIPFSYAPPSPQYIYVLLDCVEISTCIVNISCKVLIILWLQWNTVTQLHCYFSYFHFLVCSTLRLCVHIVHWKRTNLMHNLSSVYFIKHLYMFLAYLQPIIRSYTVWIQQLVLQPSHDNRQPSKKNNIYQVLYLYGCTSWWWAVDMPKTCRDVRRNILKINCASSSFFFTLIYQDARSTEHEIVHIMFAVKSFSECISATRSFKPLTVIFLGSFIFRI